MSATTGEPVTINFYCATCRKILSGPPDNRIACSSCLTGIPIPTSAQEDSSRVLHPGDEEIFKFFCLHCEQKFSSPAEFASRRFNCPICSKENVVSGQHSVAPAQEEPPEIPFPHAVLARDEFFPKFELEPCATDPASGPPEQFLLLLNETCRAVAAAPRGKKMTGDEAKLNPTSAETDREPVQKQDRCLHKPYAEKLESIDLQPIRITHPVNGGDLTILPRRRAKEETHELIPILLGEEKGVLPPPRVRQPDSIGGNLSDLFPDPGPKDDSFDRLFGDTIEIEKIFPETEKQV